MTDQAGVEEWLLDLERTFDWWVRQTQGRDDIYTQGYQDALRVCAAQVRAVRIKISRLLESQEDEMTVEYNGAGAGIEYPVQSVEDMAGPVGDPDPELPDSDPDEDPDDVEDVIA